MAALRGPGLMPDTRPPAPPAFPDPSPEGPADVPAGGRAADLATGPPPASPPSPRESGAARTLRRVGREAAAAGREIGGAFRAIGARGRAAALARFATLARDRPARTLGPVAFARRLRPRSRFLAETEALLVARSRGWTAAAPHFARLAGAGSGSDSGTGSAAAPGAAPLAGEGAWALLASPAGPGLAFALPSTPRPAALAPETAGGIAVYTAAFGAAPLPAPVFELGARLRFLCFTDRAGAAVPGWTLLPADPGAPDPAADPAGAAAFHRIHPAAVLAAPAPAARASLWLDPDRWLVGNADTLFLRWLLPAALALWRGEDDDWRAMAERHLVRGDVPAPALLAQAAAFAAAGVPADRGGWDTGMIWRRHDAAGADALAEAWWRARAEAPGADDLALYRALAADAALPRPAALPARLGTAADNAFVARWRPGPRRRPAPARATATTPATTPTISGRPLPLVFLSAAPHAKSASTLLRGHQLSTMVAEAFPDRYAVSFTEDAAAVRDAVVLLTKGAMEHLAPEAIAGLAARNVAAIGAWDDVRPDPEKAQALDAHMTLSHRQTIDFNRMFPGIPAFLVTHHVNREIDRAIGRVTPPGDRLRTGYFGDPGNTVLPPSLAGAVDLVGIDTRDVGRNAATGIPPGAGGGAGVSGWIAALPGYNCHWIVRHARPWDGWKPFLKGFVAARCGAPVITTADDGDATFYLGDDYPFFARSGAPANLEMALVEAMAAFGGPEWTRAREIMRGVAARSTDARVLAEFDAMVGAVAG